jgi:hypothetical protein
MLVINNNFSVINLKAKKSCEKLSFCSVETRGTEIFPPFFLLRHPRSVMSFTILCVCEKV